MLEKRTKLNLADKDIYINIVGGLKITEPAADLAIAMAIASASKGMQLKQDAVVFGELGLSGEVRRVPFADKRIVMPWDSRRGEYTLCLESTAPASDSRNPS